MNKASRTAITVTILSLLMLPGCGLVDTVQLPHKNPEKWRTFDPNDYGIKIEITEDGSKSFTWEMTARFDEDTAIMPYWKPWGNMIGEPAVKGYLNQSPCLVIFDTGCNPMLILSEKIVTENDLAVSFFKPEKKKNSGAFVLVDSLKIGSFELTNYPCGLWSHRPQLRLLGLPIYEPEMIMIPLGMMRQFNYFKFDDLRRELSFSKTAAFVPTDKSQWLALPFRIEGIHLLLDVRIEGIPTTLMLDTGARLQVELNESVATKLFEKRADFEKAWKKTTRIYGPYESGLTKEKQFTAKNFHFADQTLDRVKLIYSDSNEHEEYQGIIGSELFEKTVMVLDFKQNLMWVQKVKGSRFEE